MWLLNMYGTGNGRKLATEERKMRPGSYFLPSYHSRLSYLCRHIATTVQWTLSSCSRCFIGFGCSSQDEFFGVTAREQCHRTQPSLVIIFPYADIHSIEIRATHQNHTQSLSMGVSSVVIWWFPVRIRRHSSGPIQVTYCGGWLLVPLNNTPLDDNIYSNCSRGKGLLVQCTVASDCVVYVWSSCDESEEFPSESKIKREYFRGPVSFGGLFKVTFLERHARIFFHVHHSLPSRTFAGPNTHRNYSCFCRSTDSSYSSLFDGDGTQTYLCLSCHCTSNSGSNTYPILLQIVVNKWIINMVRSMSNWSTACEPPDPANKIII